jgi:hypothetical protein
MKKKLKKKYLLLIPIAIIAVGLSFVPNSVAVLEDTLEVTSEEQVR